MKSSSIVIASSKRPAKRILAQSPNNIILYGGEFFVAFAGRGSPTDVRRSKSIFRLINGSILRIG